MMTSNRAETNFESGGHLSGAKRRNFLSFPSTFWLYMCN